MPVTILSILLTLMLGAAPLFAEDMPAAGTGAAMTAAPADGNVFYKDKDGKRHFVDPVCGMRPVVGEKTAHSDLNGMRYYFCSDHCVKAFEKNPSEALSAMVLPAGIIGVSGDKMMAKCSVSGDKVAITEKTNKTTYKGYEYYFCCNKCPTAFQKNPGKYAVKAMAIPAMDTKAGEEKHGGHEGHDHH